LEGLGRVWGYRGSGNTFSSKKVPAPPAYQKY